MVSRRNAERRRGLARATALPIIGQERRAGLVDPGRKRPARQISLPLTSIMMRRHPPGDREMSVEQRLKELHITLPEVGGPIGNYVHAKRVGNLLYLSG